MSVPPGRRAVRALAALVACLVGVAAVRHPAAHSDKEQSAQPQNKAQPQHKTSGGESFDELYAKGKEFNASMKTLTARFTETTTSTLLTKPLVARGRVAVERPSRVVLRYTEPDSRTVLIDGNKLTVVWPSRSVRQVTDIGTTQGRIQKYFVNGTADDLRHEFTIDDRPTGTDRPNDYYLSMTPKRKQIHETLARLELWVDRSSLLLDTMKMTFANGDTKTMTFADVVRNAPIEPGTFALDR